jgi:hypothetical protein
LHGPLAEQSGTLPPNLAKPESESLGCRPSGSYKRIKTIKAWMGATHFLSRRLPRVSAEMGLHVLAYNLKRVMRIIGTGPLIEALHT